MKTTIKAKIIIETDKFKGLYGEGGNPDKLEISLFRVKEEINKGHYILEWINSDLSHEQEPTLIIKI